MIADGLSGRVDLDIVRNPSVVELLPGDLRVPFEPGEELPLRLDRLLDDEPRVVGVDEGVGAPLLRPPAEQAAEVAGVHRRGHLETPVALDPVERLLVAPHALREAALRPVAHLHAAMLPDDLVPLPLEH